MTDKIINDSRVHFLILVIISFLIYSQVITFTLTGSDDKTLIANINALKSSGVSSLNIINAPYMFDTGLFYRPLVTASFYIITLFTNELPAHFALNLLIHLWNVVLLYYLFVNLKIEKFSAFLLTLIFALDPVLVNSIAWLPGRNDSLLCLFLTGSFILLVKYRDSRKTALLSGHALLLLAALFTKETAVLAIPVFAIYIYLVRDRPKVKFDYSLLLSWLIPAIVWYFIRSSVIKAPSDFEFIKNIPFILQALGKILLPVNLSVLPVMKDTSYIYGFLAAAILAVMYFYTSRENKKLYLFGIIFFLIFLIPALINKNPEYSENIMLESRLYLPAIGLFIALAQIDFLKKLSSHNAAAIVSCILIAGYFAYNTIGYSKNYQNENYFWNNAVDNSPSLDLSFSGIGLINLQHENFDIAVVNYKKAIDLNPAKGEYYLKIAYCYTRLNNTEGSEEYYRKALKIFPDDHDANLILGIICFKKENYTDAEKYLLKASGNGTNDPQPDLYLLKLYFNTGMFTKARTYADKLKDKKVQIPAEIEKKLYQF